MSPTAVARRPTAAPDGVLVQEAAAGGGASYAALYDRYAQQVYNYCLRLTGSPEDAADATQDAFVNVLGRLQEDDSPVLDFGSYLFAAARNESYALMRRRSRTHPAEEPPEGAPLEPDVDTDPERAVLLRDSQEAVREANAQLAPRHREVLALREVAERSYDEIGEIMGISENAAAQLIWRARSKLKEALTAGAVASVVATSEDCEIAQLLINRLHDDEPITDEEHDWLHEHLDECGKCRAARGLVFEVAASYRAWAPVAVLATLRPDVLTSAGQAIGADWSAIAHVPKPKPHHTAIGGTSTVAVIAAAGLALSGVLHDDVNVSRDVVPAEPAPANEAKASPAPKAAAAPKPTPVHAAGQGPAVTPAAEPELRAVNHAAPKKSPQPGPPQPKAKPPSGGPAPKPKPKAPPPGKPPATPPKPGPPVVNPPPAPVVPEPPLPPPLTASECTWPDKGNGQGPGGCPPGHGGIPPGHGGTPPGQVKKGA